MSNRESHDPAQAIRDYVTDPRAGITHHTRAALNHAAHIAETLPPADAADAIAWLEDVYSRRFDWLVDYPGDEDNARDMCVISETWSGYKLAGDFMRNAGV